MSRHNNFKPLVSLRLAEKIHDLIHGYDFILPFYTELISGDYNYIDIQGNYVSGWIPRQDGGSEVSIIISQCIDNTITQKQAKALELLYAEMGKEKEEAIAQGVLVGNDDAVFEWERDYMESGNNDVAFLSLRCYTKDNKTIVEFIIEHLEIEILASLEYNNMEFIAADNEYIINALHSQLI